MTISAFPPRHSSHLKLIESISLAGTKKQAPPWMRKAGLEWFFRLCSEPKRLWKRYLVGNIKFILLVLKEAMTGKLFKPT